MLNINNLQVNVNDKQILKGINLDIKPGEVHAIMGPNGSGKSTLASVLAGKSDYDITHGSVKFDNNDLLKLSPEQRACAGIFLGFQYPVEIPGVSTASFLKAAVNAIRKHQDLPLYDAMDFLVKVKETMDIVEMDPDFLYRALNEGFSGGEKKRNEILQMLLLEPKLAILDETDSGLDIDALKIVSKGVNTLRSEERSILLVTHYQRLLNYIEPDFVHVLINGRIVKSGDKTLAHELEAKGYGWIEQSLEGDNS
jgi:Fe-S cluster assembly ATP-binding protein